MCDDNLDSIVHPNMQVWYTAAPLYLTATGSLFTTIVGASSRGTLHP